MDEWGRGPWFDPNAPEPADPGEAQPPQQPQRSTGGPRPTDTPAPGGRTPGASTPLSQRLGPDEWGDLDEFAADPDAATAGPAEGSGMRPRPTLSRPLYPPEPWNTPTYAPAARGIPSQPLHDAAQSLGQGAAGSGGTGGPTPSGRGKGRRRGQNVLALVLALLMVLLLVGSIGFVLINSPFKTAIATATDTPTVMGTPTDTPSPTPIPPPTAATVTLSPAMQQVSGSGSMTSCPSGCGITGDSYSQSQNATSAQYPASSVPQSELDGSISVTNHNSGPPWSVSSHDFTGGGYTCTVYNISLPAGATNSYSCTVYRSSPSSIPAHTIQATSDSQYSFISYDQPAALIGNGGYTVLQSDCDAADSNVEAPYNQAWANNWMASQSVPSGWILALNQPTFSLTNLSCPLGQHQSTAFNFTASVTANVNDAAYNPGAAQSLAGSRRDNALPEGYLWVSGSRGGCTPSVTNVASNNKVTLTCTASGTAYFDWTSDAKASLAAAVAGQTKTKALDTCNNHTTGVRPNSCSISITGGDGTLLPASASVVTIEVNGP